MTKSILFAIIALVTTQVIVAQNYTKVADIDPEAKAILDGVRKKYEAYASIQTSFELKIAFPEQPVEVQTGTLARNGEQYRVIFGNQEIFSDGNTLYMVLHNNKSVQINTLPDPDEDMDFLSPESIFNFYDKGQYIYTLIDTRSEGGKALHFIEFKPTDRNSEYAKLRMVVERDSKKIVRILAFAKDGSRYTFSLKNLQTNKQFPSNYFSFSKTKYPDYYLEDLR